jgi:hypothetical protein
VIGRKRNVRVGSSLSNSCRSCGVAPSRLLVKISPSRTMGNVCPLRSRGHDRSSSLLHCLVGWIDIVVVRARPPFALSEALYRLDGEKAKVANSPRIIPGVGSGPSL